MTACINKTFLCGFLGEDPKRAEMQRGGAVVTLSLATTERWRDQSGEKKSATEWHRVVIYNEQLGKTAMSYLRKGSAVYVEGTIRSRRYTGSDQVERKVTEIVVPKFGGELKLMDGRQDDAADRGDSGKDRAAGDGGTGGDRRFENDLDDNVPF